MHAATRQVSAPPDSVWQVMVDVERWPEWTPTVGSARRRDSGPFGVGSRVTLTQPRLPRATWTVTDLDEGRSFTWVATAPGLRTIGRHEIVPTADGCTITLSIEQTGWAGALVDLVWRRLTQRYVELEAESLDRHVTGSRTA